MRVALRLGGLVAAAALAGLQTVSAAAGALQMESPAMSLVNPCNGESVLTTGTVHFVSLSTGRQLLERSNFQDGKGVGAVTGLHYVVTGASQVVHLHFGNPQGQFKLTTIVLLHVIAPGTDQHFITRLVFQDVQTPSGHLKVFTHTSSRCISSSGKGQLGSRLTGASGFAPFDSSPRAAWTGSTRLSSGNAASQPGPSAGSSTTPASRAIVSATGPAPTRTGSTAAVAPKAGSDKTSSPRPGSGPDARVLPRGLRVRAH